MTIKLTTPQVTAEPAERLPATQPPPDARDLEQDADLFKQSMQDGGSEPVARGEPDLAQPGQQRTGNRGGFQQGTVSSRPQQGSPVSRQGGNTHTGEAHKSAGTNPAPARPHPGAAGQREHLPHGPAGQREHLPHGPAGQREHLPHGPAGSEGGSKQGRPGPVAQETPAAASPRRQDGGAPAADALSPQDVDDREPDGIADTPQDLHELMAAQRAHSGDIAAQGADGVAPAISPQLVHDVAQRILVSAGKPGQDKEVRIQIKDTVLQNTEVSIKFEGGELRVDFITQAAADNALLTSSRQAITTTLENALKGNVVVNVSADAEHAGGGGDERRQSRGMYVDEGEND